MRTKLLFIVFFLSAVMTGNGTEDRSEYLRKVLDNLEKIKTATYRLQSEAWEPGDTIPGYSVYTFVEEYDNPADTAVGASYTDYSDAEKKQISSCYDGYVRLSFYHDKHGVMVDDFTRRNLPFRLVGVGTPYFNYAKNIIKYVLTTQDSISVDMKDCGDEYLLSLVINEDVQVEFFGLPYHLPKPPFYQDPTSIYEVHIRKSDNLPYKVRREMSHNITEYTYIEGQFNTLSAKGITASDYIPADYEVREYGKKYDTKPEVNITGQKAPDWTLTDTKDLQVSLFDLSSKVIVMEFTGIGCGPCAASISFLNKLKETYSAEQLTVLAVEIWNRKMPSLQNYANRQHINYLFLAGNDEIVNTYLNGDRGVPFFFILDENRVIKRIIKGYNLEHTGKEITQAIDELLKSN